MKGFEEDGKTEIEREYSLGYGGEEKKECEERERERVTPPTETHLS